MDADRIGGGRCFDQNAIGRQAGMSGTSSIFNCSI
jgi:hypothetical protein